MLNICRILAVGKENRDMNTMLATTDSRTLTRMAVISKRTNSALMAGAKAMMVENVKNQMRTGVAHFVYAKKSGELREAFGTTSRALVERYINGNGVSREYYSTTAYFDVEKAAWRSFRWENIVAVL